MAAIFERKVAAPGKLADVATRRSVFSFDDHAIRFTVLTPGLPDISGLTAHRSFDGNQKAPRSPRHTLPCEATWLRPIILKILRHLNFKMSFCQTPGVPTRARTA